MKTKVSRILVFLLVLIMVLGSVACGGSNAKKDDNSTEKNTKEAVDFVIAISSEARSLDPFGSNDSTSSTIKDQMFDTLFTQNENNEIVPSLVDEYQYLDDTTLELTLKKGIKFHNDEDLTVEDVLYSIKKGQESEYTNWIVANIDLDNSKIDGEKLILKLLEPRGDQLASLCFLYIVDETTVSDPGYDPENAPIGSGPYKFSEKFEGDRIEFLSNENYFDGAPKVDKLIFRTITEASSRTIELESGGVDVIYNVPAVDVPNLEKNEDITILRTDNYSNQYIGFNNEVEPLNDVKVRQAIAYSLDKESLFTAVFGGQGSIATGPIPKSVWGYTDDVTAYEQDYEKAKELLAEAGYPDGFEITMSVSDDQKKIDTVEIFQNQLQPAGITVKPLVLENATFLDNIVSGDFEIFALGWTTNTGDADYGLYETFHTGSPTWANTTRYSNPEVDKLLEAARSNLNEDERLEQYKKAQQIIVEEVPAIFVQDGEEIIATRSNVTGIKLSPSGRHNFKGVSIED